jgi:hypothetical protein
LSKPGQLCAVAHDGYGAVCDHLVAGRQWLSRAPDALLAVTDLGGIWESEILNATDYWSREKSCRRVRVVPNNRGKSAGCRADQSEVFPLPRANQQGLRQNNRAENSHYAVRRRERKMQRFKSPRSAQRFLSMHAAIHSPLSKATPPFLPVCNPCYTD